MCATPTVSSLRPRPSTSCGSGNPVIQRGPGSSDLFSLGEGFYLDFPGDALDPGCVYEKDFRAYSGDRRPVVYGHIARQADAPDQLAVQYWFYWYYNDWNNVHESDWEGIPAALRRGHGRRGPRHPAGQHRIRPARGRRARPLGQRQAEQAGDPAGGATPRAAPTPATTTRRSTSAAVAPRASAADNTDGPSTMLDSRGRSPARLGRLR